MAIFEDIDDLHSQADNQSLFGDLQAYFPDTPDPSASDIPDITFDPETLQVSSTGTGSSGTSWADVQKAAQALSGIAVTALKTYRAFNQAGQPAIGAGVVTTTPTGTVTPNRNGTLTSRSASGRVTTTRMPVGKPYAFPDGTIVLNNGDGTYTTTRADGTSTTTPYSTGGGLGGIDSKMLLIGAGVLGLMMVLR